MSRNDDPALLHPEFRQRAKSVLATMKKESIPFRLFEGFRSPQRQRTLYAQGRTQPGDIVTKAQPWQSYHQYGIAADFVLHIDGKWSWDASGKRRAWWTRLHAVAREVGLEPLSWELPHLQLAEIALGDLQRGIYPVDGDASWAANLESAIDSWMGNPGAPPPPKYAAMRPPLADGGSGERHAVGEAPRRHRVIARTGLRLRSGPGIEFDVIGGLDPGQSLQVLGVKGEWAMVDLQADGMADGYCHRGFIEAHI
jgi:hypothetical protein